MAELAVRDVNVDAERRRGVLSAPVTAWLRDEILVSLGGWRESRCKLIGAVCGEPEADQKRSSDCAVWRRCSCRFPGRRIDDDGGVGRMALCRRRLPTRMGRTGGKVTSSAGCYAFQTSTRLPGTGPRYSASGSTYSIRPISPMALLPEARSDGEAVAFWRIGKVSMPDRPRLRVFAGAKASAAYPKPLRCSVPKGPH